MTNPKACKCELRAEVVRWGTTKLYHWVGTLSGCPIESNSPPREFPAECWRDVGDLARSLDGRGVALKKVKK